MSRFIDYFNLFMNKPFSALILVAILVSACSRKAIPAATEPVQEKNVQNADKKAGNESVQNEKSEIDSKPVKNDSEVLDVAVVQGKGIYSAKCNKCHELKDPAIYTIAKWESILKVMAPKAKLTAEETANVTAYIKVSAQK